MSDTATQLSGRPTNQPPKIGRPSLYSEEVAKKVCQHIADGGYATDLQRFGLPATTTINRWLNENEDFRAAYARARESRAETFASQIVEIADTEEDPQRARVRIEARKWIASKLLPRVYGENQRVEVQHTIGETAARVLAELSQRQKDRKQLEAQTIDVTPVHSLDEGKASHAISTGYGSTARVTHAAAAQDAAGRLEPPAPAKEPQAASAKERPRSTRASRKK